MDQPTNTPIATHAQLQKPMAQQLSPKEISSTERWETNENFSRLNINDDERNNMIEEDIKIFPSLSTVTSKKNEMNGGIRKKSRKSSTNNNNSCSSYK